MAAAVEQGVERRMEVAGAEVEISLDEQVYSQGDVISGKISILPTESHAKDAVPGITVRELWTETEEAETGPTTVTRAREHLDERLEKHETRTVVQRSNFSVQLLKARCYPFSFRLPRNARFSTRHTGWQLAIRLEGIEDVHPISGVMRLKVEPGEEFLAILANLQKRLRFREETDHRHWDSDTAVTRFQLRPPKALAEKLDSLSLELAQSEDGVDGAFLFDRAESSVADYFKSLLNLDKVRKEFKLTRKQIFLPDGTPNHADLTRNLSGLLREAIA